MNIDFWKPNMSVLLIEPVLFKLYVFRSYFWAFDNWFFSVCADLSWVLDTIQYAQFVNFLFWYSLFAYILL